MIWNTGGSKEKIRAFWQSFIAFAIEKEAHTLFAIQKSIKLHRLAGGESRKTH